MGSKPSTPKNTATEKPKETKLKTKPPLMVNNIPVAQSTPGGDDNKKKKPLFGSSKQLSQKYSSNVLKEFPFGSVGDESIKSMWSSLNILYVWPEFSSRVSVLNQNGEPLKTIELTNESAIQDVCLSPMDETLWFCCADRSVLQTDKEGVCHIRFSANHLISSICATKTSEVVIGMEDFVILYSHTGEEIHKADNRNLNMYIGSPQKITECPKSGRLGLLFTRTISVVDKMLNFIYRFEGSTLTSMWRFEGQKVKVSEDDTVLTGYKMEKDFYSHGLCFDDDGLLLIADFMNKCTIMVDFSGKYIRTLIDDNKNRLGRPLLINLANDNALWVVYQNFFTKENKIRMIQYKR